MNMKKSIVAAAVAAMAVQVFSAVPEVTSVTMSQAADRSVTITYELDNAPAVVTLDVQTNCTVDGEVKWASIGGQAVCNAQGAVWRKVTAEDADGQGRYKITWHPDLSWPDHKIPAGGARAVVSAWALDNTPDYMAVDIAAAAPPRFAALLSVGGLCSRGSARQSRLPHDDDSDAQDHGQGRYVDNGFDGVGDDA
jgi:hypothetical protein